MARHHGKKGKVYMAPGSGAAVNVASLSSWSLNMATDAVDVTAFNDSNKVSVVGLPDLSGSFSGFWDETDGTIFDAAAAASAGTAVNVYIYPDSADMTKYACGTAYVDASIQGSVNGAVEVTANFKAAGSWDTTRL